LKKYNSKEYDELSLKVKMDLLSVGKSKVDSGIPRPNNWTLPPLAYGVSDEAPCFSSAVSIAYNKEIGQHIVANRDIEPGKHEIFFL
jgi:hypothetical protein